MPFVWWILTAVGVLYGQEQSHCTDLYATTCAQEQITDVTGTTRQSVPDQEVRDRIAAEKEQMLIAFRARLTDPSSVQFRHLAASARGGDCLDSGSNSARYQRCTEELASFLFDVATASLGFPMRGLPSDTELRALEMLSSNGHFAEVVKAAKNRINATFNVTQNYSVVSQSVFPQVKNLLVEEIQDLPIANEVKAALSQRLQGALLDDGDCSILMRQGGVEFPELSLKNDLFFGAYYDWRSNHFRICNGTYLQSSSRFQYVFMIAHELAHSIDPCRIESVPSALLDTTPSRTVRGAEKKLPYSELIQCLRDKRSVQARRGGVNSFFMDVNRLVFPSNSVFCAEDQIQEAFSDWFATEVLAKYIERNHPELSTADAVNAVGGANLLLCRGAGGLYYPHSQDRMNRLIATHPSLRNMMGCENAATNVGYCDGEDKTPQVPSSNSTPVHQPRSTQ